MSATSILRRPSIMVLVTASLLQAGCAVVTMPRPLSRVPEPVDKEIWEGVWQTPEADVMLVQFGSNHVANVVFPGWKEGKFHFEEVEVVVTKGARHNYLSMREISEDNEENAYTLAQYTFVNDGRGVVVWMADTTPFSKVVEAGILEKVPESTITPPIVASEAQTEPAPASKLEMPGEDGAAAVKPLKKKQNSVRLGSSPEKILEFLEDPDNRDLFDYGSPLVLRKIVPFNKD